jgi:hypothetical protein
MLQILQTVQRVDWNILAAAAAGSVLLWYKEGRGSRQVAFLSEYIDLMDLSEKARNAFQLTIFIVLGVAIVLWITAPQTPRQAFAAGLGWTAGLSIKRERATR